VQLSAKITCDGAAPASISFATGGARRHEYTALDGTLTLPLYNLTQALHYAQVLDADVDLLIDELSGSYVRPPCNDLSQLTLYFEGPRLRRRRNRGRRAACPRVVRRRKSTCSSSTVRPTRTSTCTTWSSTPAE